MVCRIGSGVVSVVMAEISAQMLIQRDIMSRMFVMDPMRVIPVLVLVLCKSSTSIPSSLQELRSLERCSSTRERFLWGRNAYGSTVLASLLMWTFITPFVAIFPSRRCNAIAFETWIMDSSLDFMPLGSWSLVTMNVCLSRSDRATARPEHGLSITTCIPAAGWEKVTLVMLADLTSTSTQRYKSMSIATPFLTSASCPNLPGCWMVSVLKEGFTTEDCGCAKKSFLMSAASTG